jgi:hypothetical protein
MSLFERSQVDAWRVCKGAKERIGAERKRYTYLGYSALETIFIIEAIHGQGSRGG